MTSHPERAQSFHGPFGRAPRVHTITSEHTPRPCLTCDSASWMARTSGGTSASMLEEVMVVSREVRVSRPRASFLASWSENTVKRKQQRGA